MSEHFLPKNVTIPTLFPRRALSPILLLYPLQRLDCTPTVSTSKPEKPTRAFGSPGGIFPCRNLDIPSLFCTAGMSQGDAILPSLRFATPPFPGFMWHLEKYSGTQINLFPCITAGFRAAS